MIRNIVFDMGNVLIGYVPELFVRRLGLCEEDEALLLNEVFRAPEWVATQDRGLKTEQEYFEIIRERIPERLHRDAYRILTSWDEPLLIIPGMEELICGLKEQGYGIYLLSNASLRQKDYWPRIPASVYFDGTLISAEIHKIKPEPGIYQELFCRFSLKPEECLFIDDSSANIAGGKNVGMDGILFDGNVENLKKELSGRLSSEVPAILAGIPLEDSRLAPYRDLSEKELFHFFEPDNGIFLAESPVVCERALAFGCRPLSFLAESAKAEYALELQKKYHTSAPVYTSSNEELRKITGFPLTRGLLSAMYRPELPGLSGILAGSTRIVILESVVNPTNIGAIFRSAAALNMDAVLLTRDCCDPLSKRAVRVSMGTVFQIPWAYIGETQEEWLQHGADLLHREGYRTAALALKPDSLNVNAPELKQEKKLALILGTEGDGLAEKTIADTDYTVCIPMANGVDSLNVAAAGAVAFWELGHNAPESSYHFQRFSGSSSSGFADAK